MTRLDQVCFDVRGPLLEAIDALRRAEKAAGNLPNAEIDNTCWGEVRQELDAELSEAIATIKSAARRVHR